MNKGKPQLIDNLIKNQIVDEFLQNDNQPIIDIDYNYYFKSVIDIVKENFVLISIFLFLFIFLFYRFRMSNVKRKREELLRNNKEIEMHMDRDNHSNEFDIISTYNTSNNNNYDTLINEIMDD
jgi:hypothetical protein